VRGKTKETLSTSSIGPFLGVKGVRWRGGKLPILPSRLPGHKERKKGDRTIDPITRAARSQAKKKKPMGGKWGKRKKKTKGAGPEIK